MNKKITYLLLALALPGLIFIFLKIFGKNRFDIPVYYKEGVSIATKECPGDYRGQYIVPDSVLGLLGKRNNTPCLFVEEAEKNNKEVTRLKQLYGQGELQIVPLEGIDANRLKRLKNCALFLMEPWKAVLVDKERRIRGYYAFVNLEETDRLFVEIEILLSNP